MGLWPRTGSAGRRDDLRSCCITQRSVYGDSYEDVKRRVPDKTRMKKILGVEPEIDLREGLQRTVAWFRKAYPKLG